VTVGGPGLVAVGSDGDAAAVWTSPDGITWSRVPNTNLTFGAGGISSVTFGGPGLVTVGASDSEDDVHAAVWVLVPED